MRGSQNRGWCHYSVLMYATGMSFEHMPPAVSPGEDAPKKQEIEFTPEKIFGSELEVAREIAIAKAGVTGGFNQDTFQSYMDTLGQLEEGYVRVAAQQQEGKETAMLVRTAFESLKIAEWVSHPTFEHQTKGREISEHLKSEVWWQVYAAQYIGELNRKYDQKIATARASVFWAQQEKMWKSNRRINTGSAPFEQLKNGILRSVALEHVVSAKNGWEIQPERDPAIDAIDKIDLIAISASDHMFLFQIKERDIDNPDAALRGWATTEVTPYGLKEYDYMGKFQKGIERYIRDNGIDARDATGIYIEISANSTFINKETGMPKEEFAKSLSASLAALDTSFDTANAA